MSADDVTSGGTEQETEKPLDPRLNDLSPYQGCFACGLRNDAGLKLTFWTEGNDIVT